MRFRPELVYDRDGKRAARQRVCGTDLDLARRPFLFEQPVQAQVDSQSSALHCEASQD